MIVHGNGERAHFNRGTQFEISQNDEAMARFRSVPQALREGVTDHRVVQPPEVCSVPT
ncbi:MAG: hypothetical protein OXU72_11805 [Gammaproteobacteria bacterium]|nr:hypothetical protein [Gammaproteobacteria bacterium]